MRSTRSTIAALSACAVLAGCSSATSAALRSSASPRPPSLSVTRPSDQALPTGDELTTTLGVGPGFTGQLVMGGADMLLQGVGESEATPIECVSAGYRLQKVVYAGQPDTRGGQSIVGWRRLHRPAVVRVLRGGQVREADDAQAFFAASADKWRRCNGQTLVLHQPEHGADGSSRITDVVVENKVISAVVLHDDGSMVQRALGVGVGLRC